MPTRRSATPELPEDPFTAADSAGSKRKRDDEEDQSKSKKSKIDFEEERGKAIRDLVAQGSSSSTLKSIKEQYQPSFERDSFDMKPPSMDNAIYERLMTVKKSSAAKGTIDPVEKTLFSLQQSALDAARPLLFLLNEKTLSQSQRQAVKDAIRLWGNLVFEMTRERRQNILRQTHPSFKYLLRDQENFSKEEYKSLFGRKFIKSMVEAADDAKKLADLPSTSDGRRSGDNSKWGGQHNNNTRQSSGGYNSRLNSGGYNNRRPYKPDDRNTARSSSSSKKDERYRPIPFFYSPAQADCIAGRIGFFLPAWRRLTNDPWVLDVVEFGFGLEFFTEPLQLREPFWPSMNEAQWQVCHNEVAELIKKGAVSPSSEAGFVSTLFVVPKPSGGLRPVINLKPLNRFIIRRHFKMEGLGNLKHLIKPGDFMGKLDLKDACFAGFNALLCFANNAQGSCVRLNMDNSTAVCYINKQGGSKSASLKRLAVEISNWCESKGIILQANHLPGVLNTIADRESRRRPDWSDWKLCPKTFSSLAALWPVEVDLFAAPWNAQLRQFVSWLPQPGAYATNALSLDWKDLMGYAFPPYSLIKDCLTKVKQDQADLVIVCPFWPSQPWFPVLLELTCDIPRVLPPASDLLTSCQGESNPLCQKETFRLIAWKLSGRPSAPEAFRKTLSSFSSKATAAPHTLHISRPGTFGSVGAVSGIKIPCRVL